MALSWLTGSCGVTLHCSRTPVSLETKNGGTIDWHDLCKTAIDIPCQLNPLFFNGHLQTFKTLLDRSALPIHYKRWTFEQTNRHFAGTFAVDFVVQPEIDAEQHSSGRDLPPQTTHFTAEEFQSFGSLDAKPMLVVLHGVAGGSDENYLRRALLPFVSGREWEACVVISRGCAHSTLTSTLLYNARSTWDFRQTVQWIRKTFPNRPLFGVGFSMGANILIHYLAEEGPNCPLTAAVACSNPWNLEVLSNHLHGSCFMREVYSKGITAALRKYLNRHAEQIAMNADVVFEEMRNIQYLFQFDRVIQRLIWGYPTETVYYREASSVSPLLAVRIPLLAINAEDDPLSPYAGLPIEEAKHNPFISLVTTSRGGHLGWFQRDGSRWFVKVMHNTLQKFWNEIDCERGKAKVVDECTGRRHKVHTHGAFCSQCGQFCLISIRGQNNVITVEKL